AKIWPSSPISLLTWPKTKSVASRPVGREHQDVTGGKEESGTSPSRSPSPPPQSRSSRAVAASTTPPTTLFPHRQTAASIIEPDPAAFHPTNSGSAIAREESGTPPPTGAQPLATASISQFIRHQPRRPPSLSPGLGHH
ncbi:hypothetical protein Dimus_013658, partial [Dionaea muscipula]